MRQFIASAALLAGIISMPAHAATGSVVFTGVVAPTCLVVVATPGILTVSGDLKTLSSSTPGTANVTTTGGVSLSVDSAVSEIKPAADVTSTTWTPSFASVGVHNRVDGTAPLSLTGPGTDLVTVNLTGAKSGANTFVAGNYTSTVTLRCE